MLNNSDLRLEAVRSGRKVSLDAQILARRRRSRGLGWRPRSGVGGPGPGEALLRRLKSRSSCTPGCGNPEKAGAAGSFVVKEKVLQWQPAQTAIIICDMWNQHWCQGATRRVGELAPAMNRAIAAARAKGVLIIHAPSSCMDAYQRSPGPETGTSGPQGREPARAHRRVVQQDSGRREGDLPDRPVRRRLRRRAAVPAGIAVEVADRRHRDQGRRRDQRLGRRDLEPAGKPRASPTSCSWAFIPICACSAGRSACGTWPGPARTWSWYAT